MTSVQKFVTQRLFGRTVIDSLDLNQNGWYIDETQVTATADELNAAGDGITTINAYNGTGGAFTVGMLLHVSGYNAASGYLIVEKADADNSKPAQYLAIDTTASGGTTIIQDYYDAVTFNTVGASAGDPVYLSITAGTFSLSAPTGADDVVQIVGRVKLHNNAAGTVIIDLRKTEQVKIGTNEYVDASVTDAKLADDVATGLAGNGLSAASGVMAVDLNELSTELFNVLDSVPFVDATDNSSKKATVANIATTMSGTGIISAAGTFNAKLEGNLACGAVKFGAKGDTTKLTIGGIDFAYAAVPVVTNGEWTYGADAAASATSLAAGINGDTRNAGGTYYRAIVDTDGDTVRIFTKTVGQPVPATIVRADNAQPATLENFTSGVGASVRKSCMVSRTVTALDVDTTIDMDIPLPLAPSIFTVQVRKATGEISYVTDLFTIGTLPDRIHVAPNGATNVAVGDIITVIAQE